MSSLETALLRALQCTVQQYLQENSLFHYQLQYLKGLKAIFCFLTTREDCVANANLEDPDTVEICP